MISVSGCLSTGPPGWKLWAGGLEETQKEIYRCRAHWVCCCERGGSRGVLWRYMIRSDNLFSCISICLILAAVQLDVHRAGICLAYFFLCIDRKPRYIKTALWHLWQHVNPCLTSWCYTYYRLLKLAWRSNMLSYTEITVVEMKTFRQQC